MRLYTEYSKDLIDTLEEIGYKNNCKIPFKGDILLGKIGIALGDNLTFEEILIGEEGEYINEMEFVKKAIDKYEKENSESNSFVD